MVLVHHFGRRIALGWCLKNLIGEWNLYRLSLPHGGEPAPDQPFISLGPLSLLQSG